MMDIVCRKKCSQTKEAEQTKENDRYNGATPLLARYRSLQLTLTCIWPVSEGDNPTQEWIGVIHWVD